VGARTGRGWAFIELAALGENSWSRYAMALTAIALVPSIVATLLVFIAGGGPAGGVLQQYAPIALAGAVAIWAARRLHRRSWQSLISTGLVIDGRRLAIGAVVQLAIMGGQLVLADALTGWQLDLSLRLSWAVAILALLLIPLQAASEEILFRGYATQALGRVLGSRLLIALLVGLLFGGLHFNTHGGLTVPYFLVLSLVFSLVSLRDEGLELTIGGHAAMNLFAFGAAHTALVAPGAIGESPTMTPFTASAIAAMAVDGVIFYGLTRGFVRLFCRPRLVAHGRVGHDRATLDRSGAIDADE